MPYVQFLVHGVYRAVAVAVTEAGGVGHQLVHGGRMIGSDKDHFAGRVETGEDLEIGELGNELGDGIARQPLALFVQDEHGHAGDGLGHGVVAEDGVLRHGHAAGKVLYAVGAVVDDLAVAGEDGDRAGEFLFVDDALDKSVQALQPFGRKADGLRSDGRHVDGRGSGGLLRM